MANPSVTYSFSNSTTADATQVNQNFADLIDGATDGTKDYSVNIMAVAGAFSCGAAFATSGISVLVATNGGSSTVADTTSVVLLTPGATIATYSLTLPAAPVDGQRLVISSGGANEVTALTLAANSGHTLASGVSLTAMKAGMSIELIYHSTVWYFAGGGIRGIPPTMTVYTSGSGTYTPPAGCTALVMRIVAAGSGGQGSGTSVNNGSAGGSTTFGSFTCTGGTAAGGGGSPPGSGSAIGPIQITGGRGWSFYQNGNTGLSFPGGCGGNSVLGGGGAGNNAAAGDNAIANTGGGGAGGGISGSFSSVTGGVGGGAGASFEGTLISPSGSYSYSVGAGGAGGSAGTSGFAGGNGADGIIVLLELYN